MKICVLSLLLAAALCAQSIPSGEIKGDTVIAQMPDGRPITAADINKIVRSWPPEITQRLQQDPREGLRGIYTLMFLASDAEKQKLGDEQPWKDQLEASRALIMAQAMLSYERNNYSVSEQVIKEYYERNKSRFDQAKIKVIMLSLTEPMPTGASPEDVRKTAEIVMRNSHVKHPRSLTDANTLAADIVRQLRAGADFGALVQKYSDDDSKANGGDYGVVTATSSYPDNLKKAVFALKPGEVTDPIRAPNALYIVRLEQLTAPPPGQLNEQVISALRDEHLRAFSEQLGKRFTPNVLHPEFFLPTGPGPQSPLPAKP